MRTIKDPEIRKGEILDAAERLFAIRGYDATTVKDIISAVSIAKGTFYYHFKSKEDVLDGLVKRRVDVGLEKALAIAADPRLSVEEKLLAIIMAQKPQKTVMKNFLPVTHELANALLHQKIFSEYVLRLGPILTDIIQEGIVKKIFSTPHPRESTEILLTAGLVIFDTAYFHWTREERAQRVATFICAMERLIGAEPGRLTRLSGMFSVET
jgi:AcrR family transcriptional regulator